MALTELAVATKVNEGTSTSSPDLISSAYSEACNADVPEFTAIANLDLTNFDRRCSNC